MEPKVSVIIPTCNRPEMLETAVKSVINQTYKNLEIIIVDDGDKLKASEVVNKLNDSRIVYINHNKRQGGGAARNTGIKKASADFIAFLDDDDEWLENKLEIQMSKFAQTDKIVGFCFCGVKNIYSNREEIVNIEEGIFELHQKSLKGARFLTVTLIVKKFVFEEVGMFDESFPSNQEAELSIRITKKFKGLAINQPLAIVNLKEEHEHIGGNLDKRILGKEMIIKKHFADLNKYPKLLSFRYFQLALLYRKNKDFKKSGKIFLMAWQKSPLHFSYFLHYITMLFNGVLYKLLIKK